MYVLHKYLVNDKYRATIYYLVNPISYYCTY